MATKNKTASRKTRKRRSKNIYGSGDKGKATRLHSKIIRSIGYCEICGYDQNLQAAHIISRKYDATRVDLRNALCLCAGCHLKQTHFSPVEVSLCWLDKNGKRLYNKLVGIAKSNSEVDWAKEVEFLTDILRRVEQSEEIDYRDLYP